MIENLKKYESFSFPKTEFVGFTTLESSATIKMLFDTNGDTVDSLKGHGFILFDKTPFYALGGGQACDKGTISFENETYDIIDVRKDIIKKYYIHEVNVNHTLKLEDIVTLKVNSDFRHKASINHSALHMTWMTIIGLVGHYVEEVGSKLNDEKYQLQYEVDDLITPSLCVRALEKMNNEIIPAKIPANIFEVTYEEAVAKEYLYNFTKIEEGDLVRMVEFKDVVIEPCGGTHATNSSELKRVYFLNYDRNAKRILIDYTTNEEFANSYFKEKIDDRLVVINKMISNHSDLDFKSEQNELKEIPTERTYLTIQKINKLFTDVTAKVNKKLAELRKEFTNTFTKTELKEESIGKFTVIQLDDELIDQKMLLTKAAILLKDHPHKIYLFINTTDEGIFSLFIEDKKNTFNFREKLTSLIENSEFRGGGSPSMMQLKSENPMDIDKLMDFVKNI
jgi:alanyl-tRNA synthetase